VQSVLLQMPFHYFNASAFLSSYIYIDVDIDMDRYMDK